jgi:hypothetical protein
MVGGTGLNAGIEFKPVSYMDLEFDFSRSVPLRLDIFPFGVAVDLGRLLRPRSHLH